MGRNPKLDVAFAVAQTFVEAAELDAELATSFPGASVLLLRGRARIARELLSSLELIAFADEVGERLDEPPLLVTGIVRFPREAGDGE